MSDGGPEIKTEAGVDQDIMLKWRKVGKYATKTKQTKQKKREILCEVKHVNYNGHNKKMFGPKKCESGTIVASSSDADANTADQIFQFSGDVLDALSPGFRSNKRRRSALGEAARVLTPSKKLNCASDAISNLKENLSNACAMSDYFQSPLQRVKSSEHRAKPASPATPSSFKTPNRTAISRRAIISGRAATPNRLALTPSNDNAFTPARRNVTPKRVPMSVHNRPMGAINTTNNAALLTSPRTPASVKLRLYPEAEKQWRVTDFTLGKPIGKGKFGNVYYAKKTSKDHSVALKVLFKSQLQEPQAVTMLSREVAIQHEVRHENILRLYG
jgi:hypothetical protein